MACPFQKYWNKDILGFTAKSGDRKRHRLAGTDGSDRNESVGDRRISRNSVLSSYDIEKAKGE